MTGLAEHAKYSRTISVEPLDALNVSIHRIALQLLKLLSNFPIALIVGARDLAPKVLASDASLSYQSGVLGQIRKSIN